MTRFVPVTVLVVLLAGARVAGAQGTGTTLPGGVTITFSKLYIHEDGKKEAAEPETDPDSLWKYFNYAHCQCGKAMPEFVEATFEYLTLASAASPADGDTLQIWVGASCNDATVRDKMCHKIDSAAHTIAAIQASNDTRVVVPIYDAMMPQRDLPDATPDCQPRALSATVWGLASSVSPPTTDLDYFTSKSITTDSQPPPLPAADSFRGSGGDSAIEISWKSSADTSDVFGFQALCARADDDSPGKTQGRPSARYMTTEKLCGLQQAVLPATGVVISTSPIGSPVDLPDEMIHLDPAFLCGEVISPTATKLRIEGLENGVEYKVALLAVDKYQNVAGTFFASTLTPVPTTDFWEDLHDRDSQAEGGLCLLAETYGDDGGLTRMLRAFRDDTLGGSRAGRWLGRAYYATLGKLGGAVHGSLALRIAAAIALAPVVAIALLWHWLTLPGLLGLVAAAWWLRRRRARIVAWARRLVQLRAARLAAAVAVLVVGAGRADAGGGYRPYWEDNDPDNPEAKAAEDDSAVDWHVGVRIGPYTPDVDGSFTMKPGPFEQMFGSSQHMLTTLDVDRILWSGFGQLGVGVSLGYWQKTAAAFTIDSKPIDAMRKRGADHNAFRMIPTSLTATYRFTWLDDEYAVPVVPYVRGGLAYNIWWITVASGDFARVCAGDGSMCGDKAYGASLGVTGSIGLAIRAERIDGSAAMSMRQSGIQHAGIYGELSLAKVDGFGSDKKLSVGDATWFAGVDFEF